MKPMNFVMAGLLALAAGSAMAQAPAGAPAGATGICKDGTYSTAASKSGACGGHKGVQTWYAATTKPAPPAGAAAPKPLAATPAPATKPAAPAAAAPAPAPAPAAKSAPAAAATTTPAAAKTAAPGGGPGLVWVNTSSKVYHCYGTANYGTTKAGKYMSEADAKASGARADAGKACSK